MGAGISNLFTLTRTVKGRIAIFSGDAVATCRSGGVPKVETCTYAFPGTAVLFSLPLDASR
jgi:hypothetical protein